jgi:hypothetical protein
MTLYRILHIDAGKIGLFKLRDNSDSFEYCASSDVRDSLWFSEVKPLLFYKFFFFCIINYDFFTS